MLQLLRCIKNLISDSDASNPNDERPELATRVFLKLSAEGTGNHCDFHYPFSDKYRNKKNPGGAVKMAARVNIEISIYRDHRFLKLCSKFPKWRWALGELIGAWNVAQDYYLINGGYIPESVWVEQDLCEEIILCGLAERTDKGIYVKGTDKQFSWLKQRSEAGKKNRKSAVVEMIGDYVERPLTADVGSERETSSYSYSYSKNNTPLPPEGDVGDWDLGEPGNAARGEPRDQDTLQESSVNDLDAGLNLNNIQPDNQVNESTSQEPPPPKPRSKVKESDFEKVENLIGLWNALKAPEMPAEGLPLNRAGKSQQQFVKRVIKVFEKYPDLSDWKAYINFIASRDWARGKTSIDFLADFEYLTKLTTIEKHFRKARQQTFLNEYEEVTIYE